MLATETDLTSIVQKFAGVRVLVIGDVMLDVYRIGDVTRISPEAPVPVILNPTTEYRLGGAAAVAAMCAKLGAHVSLVGLVGFDKDAERLVQLVNWAGVEWCGSYGDRRQTTVKERICAVASGRHRQQLCRIDYEDPCELTPGELNSLGRIVRQALSSDPDIILVSDYAKGVCAPSLVEIPINSGMPVIVDPPKAQPWIRYGGASCIVPNREEAGNRGGLSLALDLNLDAVVRKLDQDGCHLTICPCDTNEDDVHIPSRARIAIDVTGAGDQFLAVLGLARAANASWLESATLANIAAGLQVERHGCIPVTIQELTETLAGSQST